MFKQKNIAVCAMIIGYISGAVLFLTGRESDHPQIFFPFMMLGMTGTFLYIADRRELPFIPHTLFLVMSAVSAVLLGGFNILNLMPFVLAALFVCIYGKPWDAPVFAAAYVLLGVSGFVLSDAWDNRPVVYFFLVFGLIPLVNYIILFIPRIPTRITEKDMTAWMHNIEHKYQDCDLLEALLDRISAESEKPYQKIRVIELFTDRMILTAVTRGQDAIIDAEFSDLECSVTELPDITNVRAFANVMQRRLGSKYCIAQQQNPNSARIVIAV